VTVEHCKHNAHRVCPECWPAHINRKVTEQLRTFEPVEPDPGWIDRARCSEVDPEIWHAEGYTQARRICWTCPVRLDCLSAALLRDERHGVWGGASPAQRADSAFNQERVPVPLAA